MTSSYASDILAPTEDRHREFERSSPWDSLKWKIAKTAMAMANTRDGGLIIIGVEENGNRYDATGVKPEHLETYIDDQIHTFINRLADPFVACQIHRVQVDGKQFIVVDVEEFEVVPVVCKRSGEESLQEGAIYVRTYQRPETAVCRSQTEMREILDLAIERGVRQFLSRAAGAGVGLRTQPSDGDKFEDERREFLGQIQASKLYSRGCYLVIV